MYTNLRGGAVNVPSLGAASVEGPEVARAVEQPEHVEHAVVVAVLARGRARVPQLTQERRRRGAVCSRCDQRGGLGGGASQPKRVDSGKE
jgi:hypothetical protein